MSLAELQMEHQPRQFGLWPSVGRLLLLRVRIWINVFRRSKTRRKIGTIVLLLLVLGMMVGLFIGSYYLLQFLKSPELAEYVDPSLLLNAIPTMVLTGAFFLTLITNFGVLLQALYLSKDMNFLVTAPLPMRAVFLAKLLEAVLPNLALFCAFSLPVLFGLALSNGYSLLFYPMLLALILMLALAAGGLASILVMAVVRVVPARRVAEVIGVVAAISSMLCGQIGNVINAMDIDKTDVSSTLGMMTRVNTPWSPLAWGGQGLIALGEGRWLPGLSLTLLALLLAGGIFAGTLLLAEQLYYTGWSSMQSSVGKKKPARTNGKSARVAAPGRENRVSRLIPAALLGMIRKDFWIIRRDPRNVSNVITPLILGFVMLFTTRELTSIPTSGLARFGLGSFSLYGVLGTALLVGFMLVMSLATLSFSREGKNYWILKTAPVSAWQLLWSKYLVAVLPVLAVSLAYLLISFAIRRLDFTALLYPALVVMFSMAGATGIALAFGAAGANLEWDSPQRQRLTGMTGCLLFLAVSLFLAIDVLLFLLIPMLWQLLPGVSPLVGQVIGFVLGAGLSVAAVIGPLAAVTTRVARIGEND